MALGDVIARLSVNLAIDSASFEAGAKKSAATTKTLGDKMDGLKSRMTSIGGAIASAGAAIAGSAFVDHIRDMATAGLATASVLQKSAQLANASTAEFQKAAFAAKTVGIEGDQLADIFKDVNDKFGDFAATGAGELKDFFDNIAPKVGVTAEQFRKLSGPQALQLYVSSLEKAGVNQQQMTFYMEALANDATLLLPLLKENGAEMKRFGDQAKSLGIILSDEQIAKANEAVTKMTALQEVLKAKTAQMAVENSDSLIKGTAAWEEFKIKTIGVFGEIIEGYDGLNKAYLGGQQVQADFYKKAISGVVAWAHDTNAAITRMGEQMRATFAAIPGYISEMVSRIGAAITGRLNAIWDGALTRIETVKKAFFGLYDAVVGHSYVPDMVDGIAEQMARLDAVMVNPAKTATERAKQSFEKLATDVQGIMRELFPQAAVEAGFINNRSTLEAGIKAGGAGGYTVPQLQEALKALQSAEFKNAFKDFQVSANDNAAKVEVANVRVVDSFKDMADKTLGSLQNLASAIKGGGFLDILGSVLNLGLQLGSIGAFGKGVQTRINAVPKHATGTSSASRGLALVGERGPELVNFRGGESVHSNANSRALMSGGRQRVEIVPSPYFNVVVDGRVMQAAPGIASAGGSMGSTGAQVALARKQGRMIP